MAAEAIERDSPQEEKVTQMRLLTTAEVVRMTSLSRYTIWRREAAGLFPRRRQLGGGRVGWVEDEVVQWIRGREVPMTHQ